MDPQEFANADWTQVDDPEQRGEAFEQRQAICVAGLAEAFGIKPDDDYYCLPLLQHCWTFFCIEDGFRNGPVQANALLNVVWRIYDAAMTLVLDDDEWQATRNKLDETNNSIEYPSLDVSSLESVISENDIAFLCEECADFYAVPAYMQPVIAELMRDLIKVYQRVKTWYTFLCVDWYANILDTMVSAIQPGRQRLVPRPDRR